MTTGNKNKLFYWFNIIFLMINTLPCGLLVVEHEPRATDREHEPRTEHGVFKRGTRTDRRAIRATHGNGSPSTQKTRNRSETTMPEPLPSSARTRETRALHGRTEQHGEVCRFPAPGIEEANHLSFAEREEDMHPGAIQEAE